MGNEQNIPPYWGRKPRQHLLFMRYWRGWYSDPGAETKHGTDRPNVSAVPPFDRERSDQAEHCFLMHSNLPQMSPNIPHPWIVKRFVLPAHTEPVPKKPCAVPAEWFLYVVHMRQATHSGSCGMRRYLPPSSSHCEKNDPLAATSSS